MATVSLVISLETVSLLAATMCNHLDHKCVGRLAKKLTE